MSQHHRAAEARHFSFEGYQKRVEAPAGRTAGGSLKQRIGVGKPGPESVNRRCLSANKRHTKKRTEA